MRQSNDSTEQYQPKHYLAPLTISLMRELSEERGRISDVESERDVYADLLKQTLAIAHGQQRDLVKMREQHDRVCDELRRLRADAMRRETMRDSRTPIRTPQATTIAASHEATVQ